MTCKRVPPFRTASRAPPFEAVFRRRNPLGPTALDTTTVNLSSGLFSLGGSDGADGTAGSLGGVVVDIGVDGVAGADAGASLTGTDSVTGAGVPSATGSRYQAAAKPSCPCSVRTRTHWLI